MGCGLVFTEHDLAQVHNSLLAQSNSAFDGANAMARDAGVLWVAGSPAGLAVAVGLLSEVARGWTQTLGVEFGEPIGLAVAAVTQTSMPVEFTHQKQGIDGILHNPETGRYTIVEVKTRSTGPADFKLGEAHGHTQLSNGWTRANLEIMTTRDAFTESDRALAQDVLQAMEEGRVDFLKVDVDAQRDEVRVYERSTEDAQTFEQVSGFPASQLDYI